MLSNNQSVRMPPSHYESRALEHETKKEWYEAIACWNSARAVSIGHKRRDRYEEYANKIADENGIKRHWDHVHF